MGGGGLVTTARWGGGGLTWELLAKSAQLLTSFAPKGEHKRFYPVMS